MARRFARACRLRRVYSTGWQARALASALREICEICVKFSHLHKNLKIFYNAFSLFYSISPLSDGEHTRRCSRQNVRMVASIHAYGSHQSNNSRYINRGNALSKYLLPPCSEVSQETLALSILPRHTHPHKCLDTKCRH